MNDKEKRMAELTHDILMLFAKKESSLAEAIAVIAGILGGILCEGEDTKREAVERYAGITERVLETINEYYEQENEKDN